MADNGLIRTRECLHCRRFWICSGKPNNGKPCVSMEPGEPDWRLKKRGDDNAKSIRDGVTD